MGCDICSRFSVFCTVGFAAQTPSILFIFGSVLRGQKEKGGDEREREREGGTEGGERVVDCGKEKGKQICR